MTIREEFYAGMPLGCARKHCMRPATFVPVLIVASRNGPIETRPKLGVCGVHAIDAEVSDFLTDDIWNKLVKTIGVRNRLSVQLQLDRLEQN